MKKSFALVLFASLFFTLSSCAQKKQASSTDTAQPHSFPIVKTEAEWKAQLTSEQYHILREKGTERPFTGKLLKIKDKGIYTCGACGYDLFTSESKFDSGTGWPSFDAQVGDHVFTASDHSLGMQRDEILCARCGGHLGHVFDDGPTKTGLRYCVNSESLGFVKAGTEAAMPLKASQFDTLTVGGGCFWCMEAVFEEMKGVTLVESGYAGGKSKNPNYRRIGDHAEVVQVVFDPAVVPLSEVLKVFFLLHDPTTLNRQGADMGTQYRSAVYYRNQAQKDAVDAIVAALKAENVYDNPIVTEVAPFSGFYVAEDYHQDYFANNQSQPYCQAVIQPKMEKFEKIFKHLAKTK